MRKNEENEENIIKKVNIIKSTIKKNSKINHSIKEY
jgi:hypothetical protein